tara:strand:+ start:232 stop:1059 length:828 start_codon:yes stop_codon:yes gene_type:complete
MYPASFHRERLEAVAEFVDSNASGLDCIVISGDLATSGIARDLRVAFDFIDKNGAGSWYRDGDPVLNNQDRPILIVPGNHDHYNGNEAGPNSKNFSLQFASYLRSFKGRRVGYDIFVKDGEAVAFVLGDLSFRSPKDAKNIRHRYGGGLADDDTLRDLRDLTHQIRRLPQLENLPLKVVWVIHFAPFVCSSTLELTGFRKVTLSARSVDVDAIFCGHTHVRATHKEDDVEIWCGGAATSVDCESFIHVVEVDVKAGSCGVTDFKFDKSEGAFIAC